MDATKKDRKMIHTIITLCLMLFFRFIPAPDPVTPFGMAIIGIFAGTIYGWVTCEVAWPSFACILMMAVTTVKFPTVAAAVQNGIQNVNVVTCMATLMVAAVFSLTGAGKWLGQWIVSRPGLKGHPLLLMTALYAVIWLPIGLNNMAGLILLFDVIVYLNEVQGYGKKSTWSQILIFNIMQAYMVTIYMPNTQALITTSGLYSGYVPDFDFGKGMIPFGIILSLSQIVLNFIFMKLIFKFDMSRLKSADFNIQPPDAPTAEIKATLYLLGLYLLMLVVPQYLPAGAPATFLKQFGVIGAAILFTTLAMLIRVNGKQLVTFAQIQKTANWSIILIPMTAQMIGGALTTEETGVVMALNNLLSPAFSNMSLYVFELVLLIFAAFATNILNNVVVVSLLLPIIFSVGPTLGMNYQQFLPLLTYASYLALALPSANPMTAFVHAQTDKVDTPQLMKYSIVAIAVGIVCYAVIGLPLAKVFF